MALHNLAKMNTATTGTGTVTLGAAAAGYITFAAAGVSDGEVVTYGIVDGTSHEVGQGTYSASGPTLTRTTIRASTNSNAAINLSGNAQVYICALAEEINRNTSMAGAYSAASFGAL